ncbi:MAG: membrane dipeptidase [Nitrososphaerales archaeon]
MYPLIDLHQDISYYYISGSSGLDFNLANFNLDLPNRHGDIPKFKRANVAIIFSSIFCLLSTISPRVEERFEKGLDRKPLRAWTPKGTHSTTFEHIKLYYRLVDIYSKDIKLILDEKSINESIKGDRIGFLIALEGSYMLEDVDDLRIYYNLGVRSLQLTWNFDSRYAASCLSSKDYGLTGEGEELVKEANRLGVILDLAHASKNTHMDVLELSKLPVINSHSNAKRLFKVSRNLDDEIYEEIKKKGGVVGNIFTFIGDKEDIGSVAEHIIYVYKNFGPDILALGTDYFGLIDRKAPKGLEDITKINELFKLLLDKGMKESDIEKLAYKNALRVIKENAKRWRLSLSL